MPQSLVIFGAILLIGAFATPVGAFAIPDTVITLRPTFTPSADRALGGRRTSRGLQGGELPGQQRRPRAPRNWGRLHWRNTVPLQA